MGSLDVHSLEYLFENKMPQFQEFLSHDYWVFPMYNILFKFYLQFSVWYLKLWACYLVQLSLLLSKRKLLSIRTRIPLGILHLKGSSKALYYIDHKPWRPLNNNYFLLKDSNFLSKNSLVSFVINMVNITRSTWFDCIYSCDKITKA